MNRAGAWWGASVGAVVAYASAVLASVPPPLFFFPRLWRWGIQPQPDEPAIRWYGWVIYAAMGGLIGLLLGRPMQRRPPWLLLELIAIAALLALGWHERDWFLR